MVSHLKGPRRRVYRLLGLAVLIIGVADYQSPVVLSLFYALVCLAGGWYLGARGAASMVGLCLLTHVAAEWLHKPSEHWQSVEVLNEGLRVALWVLAGMGAVHMSQIHEQMARGQQHLAQAQEVLRVQLERARQIQREMMVPRLARHPQLDLAVRYEVALQLGGDFVEVSETPGGWIAVVGDVSGKGPSAALLAALLRGLIDDLLTRIQEPAGLLSRVEEKLQPWLPSDMFVTCFCARYDRESRQLLYANAGHEPGWLRRPTGEVLQLTGTGLPLGVAPELPLRCSQTELAPGDLLVLYTDGLTDDPGVDQDRLEMALARPATTCQALVDRLFSLSERLTMDPVDDVMVLALRPQG